MSGPDAGGDVRVKPLEWVEDDDNGRAVWRARTDLGQVYTISDDGFSTPPYRLCLHQLHLGSFNIIGVAKSAAQNDYERRIRAALAKPDASNASAEARLRCDLGIVLSALRMHEQATGETFDDEGGDIAQIERDYNALSAGGDEATKSEGQAPQSQLVATDQLAGANTANGPSDITAPAAVDVEAIADLDRYIVDIVKNAMLTMWNDICADTDCPPTRYRAWKGKAPNLHADALGGRLRENGPHECSLPPIRCREGEVMAKFGMGAFVIALACCIPVGLGMAIYTEDAHWFLMCAPILIFLS